MTVDLVAFLRARLDEDEQVALATLDINARALARRGEPVPRWEYAADGTVRDTAGAARVRSTWPDEGAHIARHDPARVLAEGEAKRRIISDYEDSACTLSVAGPDTPPHDLMTGATNTLKRMLCLLALPFADHPDYRDDWRP